MKKKFDYIGDWIEQTRKNFITGRFERRWFRIKITKDGEIIKEVIYKNPF